LLDKYELDWPEEGNVHLVTRIVILWLFSFSLMAQETNHPGGKLFQHSDECIACHSNLESASGQDVSIGYKWRASMMANSARDPYWHAGVRREVMDHPQAQSAIEDKCSTCHMPMARYLSKTRNEPGKVFEHLQAISGPVGESHLALDGVSCTVCHQIQPDNFGQSDSFTGGFTIDVSRAAEERTIYGPYEIDAGRQLIMQSSTGFIPQKADHLRESELCASCHTLYTHAMDKEGNVVGELAEQVPYHEWLHSSYRETNSCQSCHMPQLQDQAPISSVLGEPRDEFSQHVFRGGNAFMLGIFARYRDELGVRAQESELLAVAQQTIDYLGSQSAALEIENIMQSSEALEFSIQATNRAGHKLPTAYPSRRAWLHVQVQDGQGNILFESGAIDENGAIAGNDNDIDGARYEPHYDLIESADQVQIYEPVMVDKDGQVTTGLLTGVRYIKDNRLLPRGFDKETADNDISVLGNARDDDDFNDRGDKLTYRIALNGGDSGPLKITVNLFYQSIGYRWAENLKAYDSMETNRFTKYYDDNAKNSAILLTTISASTLLNGQGRTTP